MVARETLAAYPARYFETWNHRPGDLGLIEKLLAPQFVWTDPSLPQDLTDLDGVHGFYHAAWAGFPDIHFEELGEPMLDEATGRVAAEWRMTGTHTGDGFPPGVGPTGNTFAVLGTDVFTLQSDGRATAIRAYYDATTLARQLGLA